MILEQPFHALPEILCVSRYPTQDYEAGVVFGLTMAILQELNGRPNPLSFVQAERLCSKISFAAADGRPRYPRPDLCLTLHGLRVGNRRISLDGWRHQNWVEAKFIRAGSGAHN